MRQQQSPATSLIPLICFTLSTCSYLFPYHRKGWPGAPFCRSLVWWSWQSESPIGFSDIYRRNQSFWRFQTLPSWSLLWDVAERNPLKLKFFLFPISVCVSKPIIYYQCGRGVFHGFPTHKSQLSLDVHQASKALTCFLSQLPRWRCLLWCPCHRPPQPQRHSGRSTPTPPALRCGAWENDGQP